MLDVKIGDIEQELQRLWDEQKDKNKIKACLFNLIVYTHEARRTEYFHKVVQSIIQQYPSRILFIEANKEVPADFLKVSVSTQTTGTDVACDQIAITSSFQNLKRIPFIVIPHLVPDLPIYLIWGQDPTCDSELLPAFEKLATRLIFDSECTRNMQQFSQQMLKQMETIKIDFVDRNWALTSSWRKVLATAFDPPEKMEALKTIKRIEITYNDRKTAFTSQCETQSLYLQAWLATQLGAKFEVLLTPKTYETYPAGGIVEIHIECANGADFHFSREKQWSKAVCHICYPDKCEAPSSYLMPDVEKGLNFMREIFFSKPSPQYANMLKYLGTQ